MNFIFTGERNVCPNSQLVHYPILKGLLVNKNMSFKISFDQSGSLFQNQSKKGVSNASVIIE